MQEYSIDILSRISFMVLCIDIP